MTFSSTSAPLRLRASHPGTAPPPSERSRINPNQGEIKTTDYTDYRKKRRSRKRYHEEGNVRWTPAKDAKHAKDLGASILFLASFACLARGKSAFRIVRDFRVVTRKPLEALRPSPPSVEAAEGANGGPQGGRAEIRAHPWSKPHPQ